MARQGRSGETKMEGELLALTYGAVVARVLKDYERTDEVNAQLDKMGYNIGVRIIDDFLAKNRHGRCKNMQETAEAIQSAFKQYINVQPQVGKWNDAQNSFSLTLDTNPLTSFVELPAELSRLYYCQLFCGIIRGALEMVQLETKVQIVADNLKGSNVTEIRISFVKKLVDALPVGED
ncbi:unnamed protein product [Oikopleura dioica]|uniref:Trafficking protein particle complex subunit n=1 Tax=Oikopleura dioica TaxID=34765 RepID=E4WZM5_OIKDI|nr:unnamed protein product [Oikopleura dioica]